ncbi:MAG: PAS domain-containing sensor histidine kinase [Bacteroidota bacterium]
MLGDIDSYSKEELYLHLQRMMAQKENRLGRMGTAYPKPRIERDSELGERASDFRSSSGESHPLWMQELTLYEANLHAVVENTTDYILSVNRRFEITVINSALQQATDKIYQTELRPGINILEACPEEVVDHWLPDFERAMSGESFKNIRKYTYSKGTNYYEFSYRPILGVDGEVRGVNFCGKNITEKEAALEEMRAKEQLLASINHSITEGIFRTNEGKIIYVNRAFVELFGYDQVDELMALDPYELYVDPKRRDDFVSYMKTENYFLNEEVQFRRKDGSTFWGLISSIKAIGEDGKTYFDGAIRNVTEIKDAYRKLEDRNQELTKLNEELDSFVYRTSHDLRAPLVSLAGLINVARMTDESAERDTYFALMEKTIGKLDGFIQDIIHYSRNSRAEIKAERIDFRQMLLNSEEELRYLDNSAEIHLNIQVHGAGDYFSDPIRLGIIFNNLLSNSIRYRDPQKAQNRVQVKVLIEEEGAYLSFADNGIGIAEEHQEHIFGMFYRGTRLSEGSGIGLYIVDEAVQKLEGSVTVKSEVGVGTTFELFLPNMQPGK